MSHNLLFQPAPFQLVTGAEASVPSPKSYHFITAIITQVKNVHINFYGEEKEFTFLLLYSSIVALGPEVCEIYCKRYGNMKYQFRDIIQPSMTGSD